MHFQRTMMAADGGKMGIFFSLSISLLHHSIAQRASCSSITSALVSLRTVWRLCAASVKWRGKIWQNHLISREGAAGCWMPGSGVILKHQCLPGKVVPHHCQLLSEKERRDGECGPYSLIIQLKTLALPVTQRKSYLWIYAFLQLTWLSCDLSS